MHLGEPLKPHRSRPPADWNAFVQVPDDRDAIQASLKELPMIDIRLL